MESLEYSWTSSDNIKIEKLKDIRSGQQVTVRGEEGAGFLQLSVQNLQNKYN